MTAQEAEKITRERKPFVQQERLERDLKEVYRIIEEAANQGLEYVAQIPQLGYDSIHKQLIADGYHVIYDVWNNEISWGETAKERIEARVKYDAEQRMRIIKADKKWRHIFLKETK